MTSQNKPHPLMRDERGNVIILVGLMAFLLIMSVGVAVDMARAQILQQRISSALDAAGLAAEQTVSNPPQGMSNKQWAQIEAKRYFDANFPPGYLNSSNVVCCHIDFPNGGINTMTLSASGVQATAFMKIFGFNTLNIGAKSQVSRNGIELVLVLDNTGSMNGSLGSGGTKLAGLNAAATQLVNILLGTTNTNPNLFIGLVPFAQTVNVSGSGLSSWLDPSDPNSGNYVNGETWQGCLTSRSPSINSVDDPPVIINGSQVNITMDISEDAPAGTNTYFDRYFYSPITPDYSYNTYKTAFNNLNNPPPNTATSAGYVNFNPWAPAGVKFPNAQYVFQSDFQKHNTPDFNFDKKTNLGGTMGPNLLCSPAVVPMTSDTNTIINGINNMTASAQGSTYIPLGLAWGYRMLSPHWRNLWNDPEMTNNALPLDYHAPNSQKVMILMTDGTNYVTPGIYSGYDFLSAGKLGGTTSDPQAASIDLDNRTRAVCESIKSQNITLYTIGFGNASFDDPPTLADRSNSTLVDVPLLQACATSPNYFFLAPTNEDLQAAFQAIANSLQVSHLSK